MLKAQKGALWQKIRSADENSKKGTIFADGSRNWNRLDQKKFTCFSICKYKPRQIRTYSVPSTTYIQVLYTCIDEICRMICCGSKNTVRHILSSCLAPPHGRWSHVQVQLELADVLERESLRKKNLKKLSTSTDFFEKEGMWRKVLTNTTCFLDEDRQLKMRVDLMKNLLL